VTTEPSSVPADDVDAVAESYLDASLALDPMFATFLGVPGGERTLTDFSPAGHEARAQVLRGTLSAMEGLHAHDDRDAVTLAALRERLEVEADQHERGMVLRDLNNIASPVQQVRDIFDLVPTATVQDWDDVAARLGAVEGSLAGYRRSLQLAVDEGWRPPLRQIRACVGQAEQFSAPDGFFVSFAENAAPTGSTGDAGGEPLPDALRETLRANGGRAAAAYADLAGWMREHLLPAAREEDAVGRDDYAVQSRLFVGATVDLDETYAWGLEELARIEDRMAEVGRRLAPDAPAGDPLAAIDAGIAALDADPGRHIEGAEAFRDWMQEVSDRSLRDLDGTHFDIPEPLLTLRCRIAPSSSGVVYYTGPSEDFSRPGQMWWSVPQGVTSFSTWRETSTVYHEGVPGHHLQIGQSVYRRDRLNRWRSLALWVSGHGEGWALYAERLMEDLGHLEDPGDLLGMLDAHALRASRVVVDIGVHCRMQAPEEVGGGTWDADKAWTFLRRHTRVPEEQLRFEWERYMGWPGQAPSYKIGERMWLELREEVRRRQGAAFDLKRFHADALDLGSLPLDVLRTAVLAGTTAA
jgi:uncharacterized protein (DUF885 family)